MHVVMFVFALSRREFSEALGQIPRLVLAGPSSLLGMAPMGNTGRSNVGLFTSLPIAADLDAILKGSLNQKRFFNGGAALIKRKEQMK